MAQNNKYTAAICAAPKVLANAGVLENKQITAYPGSLDPVDYSAITLQDTAIVTDGKIITSRGPGTAMDFTLTLIQALTDKTTRDHVEQGLVRPAAHRQSS